MSRANRVAGIGLLVFAAFVAFETRKYPLGSIASPGPGFWPLALSVILAGLAIALMLRRGQSTRAQWGEIGHAITILAGVAFAALALERIGYRVTIFVLMLFYLALLERLKLWLALLVALGFAEGTYFLFHDLLRVQLPTGPFGL